MTTRLAEVANAVEQLRERFPAPPEMTMRVAVGWMLPGGGTLSLEVTDIGWPEEQDEEQDR